MSSWIQIYDRTVIVNRFKHPTCQRRLVLILCVCPYHYRMTFLQSSRAYWCCKANLVIKREDLHCSFSIIFNHQSTVFHSARHVLSAGIQTRGITISSYRYNKNHILKTAGLPIHCGKGSNRTSRDVLKIWIVHGTEPTTDSNGNEYARFTEGT